MARRLALFIDAENVSATYCDSIMSKTHELGAPVLRRAYGDWLRHMMRAWWDQLSRHAIEPIIPSTYQSQKGMADGALIVDAMDAVHQQSLDGFVLATSDNDFTPLAKRLREKNCLVYGMGEYQKTPYGMVAVCDDFLFLEGIGITISSIVARLADQQGWAKLAAIGSALRKEKPDFNYKSYGYARLKDYMQARDDFETHHDGQDLQVRVRADIVT